MQLEKQLETITGTTMCDRLGEKDDELWSLVDRKYRPMVLGAARRAGLPSESAEDATQECMRSVYEGLQEGRYDRSKGRFRPWLFGIANNQIRSMKRKELASRRAECRDSRQLDLEDDALRIQDRLDREWASWKLERGLELARRKFNPKSIVAFKMLLQGQRASSIAASLEMTPNAVHLVKFKVGKYIKEIGAQLDSEEL